MAQRTTPPEIPGFTFIEWLGGGGFADVFRYRDSLGRGVAVKVLHQTVNEATFNAFAAEAVLMARLSGHPNIVTIHSSGLSADGRPFLVMEECSTAHLGIRVANRVLATTLAMEYTVQLAGAVETVHRQDILHRDIKPANILFTGFQRPALTDFGISASHDFSAAANALSPLWAPSEMHPDSPLEAGPWSDVFSLAATTWAMLVGRSPLAVPGGDNERHALRERARSFVAPRTGRPDVPEMLEQVLGTAMAAHPARRYSSALEFARAIQAVQASMGVPVTPVDVLTESEDHTAYGTEHREPGSIDSGWLLGDSGSMLTAGYTMGMSSLTGGYTFHDTMSPAFDPTPPGMSTGAPGPGVLLRGHGFAQAGLRHVEGLPVPEPKSLEVNKTDEAEKVRRKKRRKRRQLALLVTGITVIATAVTFGVLWFNGVIGPGAQDSQGGNDRGTRTVPAVVDASGRVTGQEIKFTWTNPDPQPADSYLVEVVGAPESEARHSVDEPSIILPLKGEQTCVKILLRRAKGQVSEPVQTCVRS